MGERWALALAAAAAVGAAHPRALPLALVLAAVAAARLVRRPELLCLAVAALTSTLAARAEAGLAGVPEGDVHATVTLLTDPRPALGGLRAEARWGARHVDLRASDAVAPALADRLAGERLVVRGTVGPLPAPSPWSRSRHLAGRLRVLAVEEVRPGDLPSRAANGLRRTLEAGAAGLDDEARALFTGLVVGDDRRQSAALADDFRGAGLTHLLAVSGQNVAFVIALAGPVLRRLRIWPRALASLALIGLFATMTRFEPSVVRASAMAALALVATTVGAPAERLRVLALALTALLVVDPLLVHSVGFRLSVAAAGAIVVGAPALQRALPGPRWLAEPLAVTVAAQLGVAPVLLAAFGPLPLASIPANLLAVPAAGLVMTWGLTGGMVAGLAAEAGLDGVAALLHLPTRLLVGWLAGVASRAAALPLGHLRGGEVLAAGVGLALLVAAAHLRSPARRPARAAGGLLAVVAVAVPVLTAHAAPGLRTRLAPGVVRWHAAGTDVVVLGGGSRTTLGEGAVLEALREAGVRTVDVLVLADARVPDRVLAAVAARHPIGVVVHHGPAPERPGAAQHLVRAPPTPLAVPIGGLVLHLTPTADRLVVEATRAEGGLGPSG